MPNSTCTRCSRLVARPAADELCETCRRHETDQPAVLRAPGYTPFLLTPNADPDPLALTQRITRPQLPPPVLPGYDLREILGGGGMGVVYLAHEVDADRLVALKLVRAATDPAARVRFRVEVQAMARLDHPNVVRVYAVELDRPDPFFTMEPVDGPGLDSRIITGGPLPQDEAARIMEQVARAVQHAHAEGVIHRDLKPGNVIVGSDGVPKVTDFGLAKRIDTEDGLTVYDAVLGTPGFMAPEQTGGRNDEVGKPADVYGLGSTLYALLTGQPPFGGIDPVEVAVRVRTQPPRPPSELRRGVSDELEAVVLKCLEKDPAKRFATAGEMADELARWRRGERTLTRPPSRAVRLGRAVHRRRSAVMACLVPFVLLATGAVPTPPLMQATEPVDHKVNLLDNTRMPRFESWRLNGVPLRTSKDGCCIIDSMRHASLLQISPSLQTNRYRFQMEFRQEDAAILEGAGAGLYFGHDERLNDRGVPVHTFYCVQLNSFLPKQRVDAGVQPEVRFDRMRLIPYPPQDSKYLAQQTFAIAAKNYSYVPVPTENEPWRYVEVEVTPTSIRVLWREKPGDGLTTLCQFNPTTSGDYVRAYGHKSKPEVIQRNLSLFESWHPQQPFGIYNYQSRLVIRSAVLEPLPE